VVAVDMSSTMLDVLTAKALQLGVENVEPVQAGFLSHEHEGNAADVVYSRNALHHLPDFWKAVALERIAGILKPGGTLRLRDLVFAFDLYEADRIIEDWLTSAPDDPTGGWTRPELEAHLREEHSTFRWLLEPMLDRADLEIREASYDSSKIPAASAPSVDDPHQTRRGCPANPRLSPTSSPRPLHEPASREPHGW
jgi:SAM-dependent methyltransferase